MTTILAGLPGAQAYLDDMICYGATQQDHDITLQRVLNALNNAGLTLNMHKCKFNQICLHFLGHTLSKDELQIRSVQWLIHLPHDASSLRSFLGLASWYGKFIPEFSTVVEPLRATLRESTGLKFTWTAEAESSFAEIKRLIAESPALALYDPDLPRYVTTDASDYGLVDVLTQLHTDNTERVVAFAEILLLNMKHLHVSGQ